MNKDFGSRSARSLVEGLNSGTWTSTEITHFFLDRIAQFNNEVHAIPYVLAEEALSQAKESDARRANGKPLSRLDGLPMTIKDTIRVKGYPSTYGAWPLRNYRPKGDSQIIDVLRKSGIVFLGRSAIPTGAFDWNCKNQVYPECVNPFDASRTPGGSSGGAAAALAKGMTPLDLGSDLGGSIRYPSHCCGVYGLRTTDGWLPIEDIGPEGFGNGVRQLLTFGPMARTVEDLDLLLEVYSEKFPRDEMRKKFHAAPKLKIAYSRYILDMVPDSPTREAFERFLQHLVNQGHELMEQQPDVDFEEVYYDWGMIAGHEYTSAFPMGLRNTMAKRIFAWWLLDRRLGKGPVTTHFKRGMLSDGKEYLAACARRKLILEKVDRFFDEHALWILPVAPSSALPLSMCGKEISTQHGPVSYTRYVGSYTVPTTSLGTPVLACPIGSDEAGMPIGVQIHGPRFSDRWLTHVVDRFQK